MLYDLISRLAALKSDISVLEVGGSDRLGRRLRAVCEYWNTDVRQHTAKIDFRLRSGKIACSDHVCEVALASFVLSQISRRSHRIDLLKELRRTTKPSGFLLLIDDLDRSSPAPVRLDPTEFFQAVRLGRSIDDELAASGWRTVWTLDLAESDPLLADDLPALIAADADEFMGKTLLDEYFSLERLKTSSPTPPC